MKKILIVGQTPPPFGGQAVMIEKMLGFSYDKIKLYHIRMSFSGEMDEIGKFKLKKVFHLFYIIYKIILFRLKYNIKTLYYPPAGPDKVPVIRDIIILLCTRWLFKTIIFHFHAGGLASLYPKLSPIYKFFFRKAYFYPEISIRSSEKNPDDANGLKTKKEFIIPLGIEDHYTNIANNIQNKVPQILFVGFIVEHKGIIQLIEAAKHLKDKKIEFQINLMGKFESPEFERLIKNNIQQNDLKNHINFLGVLTGQEKYNAFSNADILCHPSFLETFGIVLLEGMQFKLPVVATDWGVISTIVEDGKSGLLFPLKDSKALAEKLALLIENDELRKQYGETGREVFLQKYTLHTFCRMFEEVLHKHC
ncbi:hypothetical protein BKI52_25875 [marine bacterium AO1-C]|nr:hypothetical protein BKI52_25875 [marine bacterium AO1-C]